MKKPQVKNKRVKTNPVVAKAIEEMVSAKYRQISINKLAALTGVKPSTIWAWRHGKQNIRDNNLYKMASVLGVELDVKKDMDNKYISIKIKPKSNTISHNNKILRDQYSAGNQTENLAMPSKNKTDPDKTRRDNKADLEKYVQNIKT